MYKFLVIAFGTLFVSYSAYSQEKQDTTITSIDANLVNLFNPKNPVKTYKISAIKVTGNRFFDENLLISISTLNVGDEIKIPGADNFSKAINKLWAQNYFSDVEIYVTKVVGINIDIEIVVTERPRLANFTLTGIKKGEADDLTGKMGLVKGRVVTEAMKRSAVEAIKKYYFEKGYQNTIVKVDQRKDLNIENSTLVNFGINKGIKVRISNISFVGNTIDEAKLKKQLKDTKEQSRLTLHPAVDSGGYPEKTQSYTYKKYIQENGYLFPSKTKRLLDPYVRLKFFSSAKYNEKKFIDDKEKVLAYYNTLGYRDAVIVGSVIYPNSKKDLNIYVLH